MWDVWLILAVVGLVILVVVVELAAAVLPVLIVVTLVPPEERSALAEVIAAVDSSPRLRLWSALRLAVAARRRTCRRRPPHRPSG